VPGVQSVVAYVPDLMDRSKVSAAAAGEVRFVAQPAGLAAAAATADLVVVDLSRPGVLDALIDVAALGVRVIGFGSHVDRDLLDEARSAGCSQVLARSAFFGQLASLLA
jgi:hypothetical protein